MELKTSVNPYGQIYIPANVRKATGLVLDKKVIIIGNARTVFIIPNEMTAEEALESLAVINTHLEHRMKIENRKMLQVT